MSLRSRGLSTLAFTGVVLLVAAGILSGCRSASCVNANMDYPAGARGEGIHQLERSLRDQFHGDSIHATIRRLQANFEVLDGSRHTLATAIAERSAGGTWLLESTSQCS